MIRKSIPSTTVTSIYIDQPYFLKFELNKEVISLVLCGQPAIIKKENWLEFVHAVTYERGKEFTLDNHISIDTSHEGMVYVKRFDSFSGCSIDEWQDMTSKVTHLLKNYEEYIIGTRSY